MTGVRLNDWNARKDVLSCIHIITEKYNCLVTLLCNLDCREPSSRTDRIANRKYNMQLCYKLLFADKLAVQSPQLPVLQGPILFLHYDVNITVVTLTVLHSINLAHSLIFTDDSLGVSHVTLRR